MNVYVAGCFESRSRLLQDAVPGLEALGFRVISTWLWVPPDVSYANPESDYMSIARRDLSEVARADLFIVDTIDVNERGGREVELGYAIRADVPALLVGPARNVFHHAMKRVDTWDKALMFLKEAAVDAPTRA